MPAIEGINQIPVGPVGDFSTVLRHILRQATNVIMAGEIRDAKTANIMVQAALTGHLVFSTLHTDDAPSAMTRLMDIGIPPYLVRDSVRGVVAQRLLKLLCSDCKEEYKPEPLECDGLGLEGEDRERMLFRGKGCGKCRQTGYRGRTGVFSLLAVTEAVRQTIEDKSAVKIEAAARGGGWSSLREAAMVKLWRGETASEEVLRVT